MVEFPGNFADFLAVGAEIGIREPGLTWEAKRNRKRLLAFGEIVAAV